MINSQDIHKDIEQIKTLIKQAKVIADNAQMKVSIPSFTFDLLGRIVMDCCGIENKCDFIELDLKIKEEKK